MASFCDPAGHLLPVNGRILQVINPPGKPDLRAFLESRVAPQLIDEGRLVRTEILAAAEVRKRVKVG